MHAHSARSAWRGLIGALALALALAAAALPAPAAAAGPSLAVAAGEGANQFQVVASGFDDNEALSYSLTSPSGVEYGGRTHTTNGDGAVPFSFVTPRSSEMGAWRLTVWEKAGDGASATAAVAVTSALGSDGVADAVATGVAGGVAVAITTSGDFDNQETVYYWLTGPDGVIYLAGADQTSGRGRVEATALVTPAMPRGQWTVSIYGPSSDHLNVGLVTIT
jgi:hypothetical protein